MPLLLTDKPYNRLAKWNMYHAAVATDAKWGEKVVLIYVTKGYCGWEWVLILLEKGT
jgi:hypothetical protein